MEMPLMILVGSTVLWPVGHSIILPRDDTPRILLHPPLQVSAFVLSHGVCVYMYNYLGSTWLGNSPNAGYSLYGPSLGVLSVLTPSFLRN